MNSRACCDRSAFALVFLLLAALLAGASGQVTAEAAFFVWISFGLVLLRRYLHPSVWAFAQPDSLQRLLPPRSPPLS